MSEVFASLGSNVVKQLYDDLVVGGVGTLRRLRGVVLHVYVAFSRRVVDAAVVSLGCDVSIDGVVLLIDVSELL